MLSAAAAEVGSAGGAGAPALLLVLEAGATGSTDRSAGGAGRSAGASGRSTRGTSGRGAAVASEEGLRCVRLGVVGVGGLLQEQVRHRTSEGVGWGFGFDDGFEVAIFGAEAAEEVEDLAWLRDGVADIPELIDEALELGAVIMDGEVALLHAAELSFQENSALKLVVAEVALDVGPEGEGGDVRLVDEVEDVGGNGGVDPIDKAAVNLPPLGVALSDRCRRADMVLKPELAKHRIKAAAPLTVVGGGVVEDDGNVVADVHRLNDGGRGWLRRSGVVEVAIGGGSRGASRRVSHGSRGSGRNRGSRGGGAERVEEGGSWGL